MTTSSDIEKQIAELQQKAAQLRAQEKIQVITDLKAKIKQYQLTASDLGLNPANKSGTKTQVEKIVKYRDHKGNTWSGGRGRKPQWVKDALTAGQDIEKFAV